MTPKIFFTILAYIALASSVLLLSHYDFGWLAGLLIGCIAIWRWVRAGRTTEAALACVPQLLAGGSVIILISLTQPPIGRHVFPVGSQLALALLYWLWLLRLQRPPNTPNLLALVAGIHQVFAISAIFLATAFWHWPALATVVSVWVVSYVNALWYLSAVGQKVGRILAATWALIAAQVCWLLYIWQVNYDIASGYIIVPQAAIITLGLGYCFASIQTAHSDKRLSRRRLIEYVVIAAALLAIVIAGTRWNGTT